MAAKRIKSRFFPNKPDRSFLMARCTNVSNFISLGPVNVMFFFLLGGERHPPRVEERAQRNDNFSRKVFSLR